MYRATVWLIVILLVATPTAMAQDRPEETPAGQPEETTQDRSQTNATGRPEAADDDGTEDAGRSGQAAAGRDGPAAARTRVEDTPDGFGARPADPDARRPDFSYDAARAALAMARPGAPTMKSAMDAVIEFRDEDGDGAYDLGEPVLQRHALRDLDMEIRSPSEHRRDAVYALPDNGSVTFRFHLAPTGTDEAAKFDVVFDDYPFTDDTSRVAIGMRIASGPGLRLGTVDDAPALVAEGSGDRPYLSWLANATADGDDVAVAASVHVAAKGDDAFVFWAYPQAASIVHDPLMGYVSVPLETLGDALVFVAALGAGGVFLLAGYEARRRFRA